MNKSVKDSWQENRKERKIMFQKSLHVQWINLFDLNLWHNHSYLEIIFSFLLYKRLLSNQSDNKEDLNFSHSCIPIYYLSHCFFSNLNLKFLEHILSNIRYQHSINFHLTVGLIDVELDTKSLNRVNLRINDPPKHRGRFWLDPYPWTFISWWIDVQSKSFLQTKARQYFSWSSFKILYWVVTISGVANPLLADH